MKVSKLLPIRILYLICLAAVLVVAGSCVKQVAGGKARATAGARLRVMSYNIHHGNPPSKEADGVIDLPAIVNAIRQQAPDLVALQEVDVHTTRSGPGNQAEEIAKQLGMKAYFGKAIDYQGGEYGVAVLSKYPMTETAVIQLPAGADPKSEPRILVTAKITLPKGKVIRFGSTHLDVRNAQTRDAQVQEIVQVAKRENSPFIVAGDFNATPESSAIRLLDQHFTRTCQDCEPTIPVINPKRTIDFIAFTKAFPFKVVSQKVVPERYASDHLPVVAELAY